MTNPTELNKRMQDQLLKSEDRLYVHNSSIREIFGKFVSHQMVVECLMSHVSFFYPLPYWRLD